MSEQNESKKMLLEDSVRAVRLTSATPKPKKGSK